MLAKGVLEALIALIRLTQAQNTVARAISLNQ